jgi:hypothetical protein
MSAWDFRYFVKDGLDIVDLDGNLHRGYRGQWVGSGSMMVVVMMWRALDVMMVMNLLAWTALC